MIPFFVEPLSKSTSSSGMSTMDTLPIELEIHEIKNSRHFIKPFVKESWTISGS